MHWLPAGGGATSRTHTSGLLYWMALRRGSATFPFSPPSSPHKGSGRVCETPAAGSTQPPEAVNGAPAGNREASVDE
eukprot:3522126-Pyramimonas_sp.AAC.1